MQNEESGNRSGKKEIDGMWVILFFFILLSGVILLGLLT